MGIVEIIEIIARIIIIYAAINALGVYIVISWLSNYDLIVCTPMDLYRITKMNLFGCIMVWTLLVPFCTFCSIGGLIKWLFTVGRKKRRSEVEENT